MLSLASVKYSAIFEENDVYVSSSFHKIETSFLFWVCRQKQQQQLSQDTKWF